MSSLIRNRTLDIATAPRAFSLAGRGLRRTYLLNQEHLPGLDDRPAGTDPKSDRSGSRGRIRAARIRSERVRILVRSRRGLQGAVRQLF